MTAILLPAQYRKQPQSAVRLANPGFWRLVDIQGMPLRGTAASFVTQNLFAGTGLSIGRAGKCLNFPVDGARLDYGFNSNLYLSTQTGIVVVEVPKTFSQLRATLFNTNCNGAFAAGFTVTVTSSGTVFVLKQDIVGMATTTATVKMGGVSTVAWSYNNVSGSLRIAIDGVLETFNSPQTFNHGLVARNSYYAGDAVQANAHKQYLFALSPECDKVANGQLVKWSLNPWSIFKAPARRIWAASTGGTTHDLVGIGQIASAEALGSLALSAGVASSGVATGEALGSAGIAPRISTIGIATAEVIGSTAVAAAVSAAGGIETAEAEGSPQLAAGIAGSAIASTEALGDATLAATIQAAGITSIETVGAPEVGGVAPANVVGAGAIASTEASGNPAVYVIVESAGITTAEILGQPAIGVPAAAVTGTGQIATGEAFGSPAAALAVAATGVESGETPGNAAVVVAIVGAGNIATTEAVGTPLVGEANPQEITGAGGIVSAAALGSPNIHPFVPYTGTGFQPGSGHRPIRRQHRQSIPAIVPHSIGAAGIESVERFGYPTLIWRGRTRRIREEEFLLGRAA